MTPMKNRTLEVLRAQKIALGFGLHHLRTVAAPQLAAAAGYDWLFIDTEHGAFSVQEATQICLVAPQTGVTPIVRVCADAIDEGTRVLDNGAMGIIVPHVNTAREAQRLVDAFRYPPLGHRSWGGPSALYGYREPSLEEAQVAINREILICVMIETPQAVLNAQEIAAVPGVDILLIGTSDLTSEMGIAGQIGHEKVQSAYAHVAAACVKQGKYLGLGGVYDDQWAARYIGAGARFVLAGNDHGFLLGAATSRATFLRDLVSAAPVSTKIS